MSSKFPITKPIHPKFIIQHIVASAVRSLYGVSWDPRVVRQVNRALETSNLTHIDYAVPCFELARDINVPVHKVTEALAGYLAKHVSQDSSSEYFCHFTFDAVGGYLNIELTENFIAIAAENSAQWFSGPELLYKTDHIKFLTLGYNDTFGDNTACHRALNTLSQLVDILQTPFDIRYLFSDLSEGVLPSLAEKILLDSTNTSPVSPRMKMRVQRAIKSLIVGEVIVEGDLDLSRDHLFTKILPQQDDLLLSFGNSRAIKVVRESTHMGDVQQFIDEGVRNTVLSSKIIYDDANRAVYYSNSGVIIPLRSFEGYLYNAAYVLYEIYQQHQVGVDGANFVFISPLKKHTTITEFLNALENVSYKSVLFDPGVSKLDLIEFNEAVSDVHQLISHFSQYVETMKHKTNDSEHRQRLLLLVDFPMDISHAIAHLQLPALFDLLNQAAIIVDDSSR